MASRQTSKKYGPTDHSLGNDTRLDSRFTLKATGAEAASYDFTAERPPGETIGVKESMGLLIKSCLGSGVLAMHASYMKCGLWCSLFLNLALGFVVGYSMYSIAKSARRLYGRVQVHTMSYPDLAEASLVSGPWIRARRFGKMFRSAVQWIMAINLFGSCCVYQVVMARSLKQLVEKQSYVEEDNSVRIYIILFMVPCVLICMITSLKTLAPVSILGDLIMVLLTVSTIFYAVNSAEIEPIGKFPVFRSIPGMFEFISICVFSVQGIGAVLPLDHNMTEPEKMPLVIFLSMAIVIPITMVIGFFGCWGFGEHTLTPITINFPMTPYGTSIRVTTVVMVLITFAMNFWIPFNYLWPFLKLQFQPNMHWMWERAYKTIYVVVVTAGAVCFPRVKKFMRLLVTFCVPPVACIFPAIIELSIDWTDPGLGYMKWRLLKAIIIIAFGLFLCVICIGSNIIEQVQQIQ